MSSKYIDIVYYGPTNDGSSSLTVSTSSNSSFTFLPELTPPHESSSFRVFQETGVLSNFDQKGIGTGRTKLNSSDPTPVSTTSFRSPCLPDSKTSKTRSPDGFLSDPFFSRRTHLRLSYLDPGNPSSVT